MQNLQLHDLNRQLAIQDAIIKEKQELIHQLSSDLALAVKVRCFLSAACGPITGPVQAPAETKARPLTSCVLAILKEVKSPRGLMVVDIQEHLAKHDLHPMHATVNRAVMQLVACGEVVQTNPKNKQKYRRFAAV